MRIGRHFVVAMAFLLAAACSSDKGTSPSPDALSDVRDVKAPDHSGQVHDSYSGDSIDLHTKDLPETGDFVSPPCTEMPFAFGCACDKNTDCKSGWCVLGPDGRSCSVDCVEDCPAGYECVTVAGSCPDCQQICLPKFTNLCRPCSANSECLDPMTSSGGLCVLTGETGSFCGAHCKGNGDCPEGFTCAASHAVGGFDQQQCVPVSGQCQCNQKAIMDQAHTQCVTSNDLGHCKGVRQCKQDGLSACSAPEAVPETCDTIDNDCDGSTDEFPESCPGGGLCHCGSSGCKCSCPEGLTDCGGVCVDLKNDIEHCGNCDNSCNDKNVETWLCQKGACAVVKCLAGFENLNAQPEDGCECQINIEVCDGRDNNCDRNIDEEGAVCPSLGECSGVCSQSTCVCSSGCENCDNVCMPLSQYLSDPLNCGYCGNRCELPHTKVHGCVASACTVSVCMDGYADCNGLPKDGCEWKIAPESCNAIDDDCNGLVDDNAGDCKAPRGCVGGTCVCPVYQAGIKDCSTMGGECTDSRTDPANCGACGYKCVDLKLPGVAEYVCIDSKCVIKACEPLTYDLDGLPATGCECQKTSVDEACDGKDNNCNGVADEGPWFDCTDPMSCVNKQCICNLGPNVKNCVANTCTDLMTDVQHCGACGNSCYFLEKPGVETWECVAGKCQVAKCQIGYFNLNGDGADGCECQKTAALEACDSVDNNCDGKVDEEPTNCPELMHCEKGLCSCPADKPYLKNCGNGCTDITTDVKNCGGCGKPCQLANVDPQECKASLCVASSCVAGWKDCDGKRETGCEFKIVPEECNLKDDDCDGATDEDAAGTGQLCATGLKGVCADGKTACEKGVIKCKTVTSPGTVAELCDGLDNDCDGTTDEGDPGNGAACTIPDVKGECAKGTMQCTNGKSVCIQVNQAKAEVCDGLDNNCDGTVDGLTEKCSTICGQGQKTCANGTWTDCSAVKPIDCMNYSICQTESKCLQQCPPAPSEVCNGKDDNCSGSVDETFACIPGKTEEEACGTACGKRSRNCGSNCQWGAWTECLQAGVCTSGQTESRSCSKCGTETRKCNSSCQWDAWGTCSGQRECEAGTTATKGCEKCGTQSRSCSASCYWTAWSTCGNQGTCTYGEMETQACGICGTRARYCLSSCAWGSFGSCVDNAECSPGATKWCIGCAKQTCKSTCKWGPCEPYCGSSITADGCYCDSTCTTSKDCCKNACTNCSRGCSNCQPSECNQSEAWINNGFCYCDPLCISNGDCCYDARSVCGIQTCTGGCDTDYSDGCDCDWNCGWITQGKCCADKGCCSNGVFNPYGC